MASLNHPSCSSFKPRIHFSVPNPLRTLRQGNLKFSTFLNRKSPSLPQTKTQILRIMVTESGSTKRPVCPKCSKPTRICLCNRLKTPPLNNSVNVTILQHSLEKKHPLNSARIARIGLKNVDVVTVSDVIFQARFFIWLLESSCETVRAKTNGKIEPFDEMPSRESEAFVVGLDRNPRCTNPNKRVEITFDPLITSDIAVDDLRKGFVVKKLQRRPLVGSNNEMEETEEFEIVVPPGSVLLFPSEESVGVEAVNFEVKNLIVLDGTWAKAKRMYYENPWLRFLPHVRLDIDKLSLYNEVRPQPRAGYLSTIESIVYALKAVGEDSDGLDGLLDVFESMVGDQRRCQNERLIKASEVMSIS